MNHKTTLTILLGLVLLGCTTQKPTLNSNGPGWSALGWETNTPSLDPVTNQVPSSRSYTNRPILRQ